MFKKQLSVLLSIFILVSNIGLAISVHYCNESVASVSLKSQFYTINSDQNCCGIVKKKSSCCHDKVFHFQKKSENVSFDFLTFSPDFIFYFEQAITFYVRINKLFKTENTSTYYCDAHAPPFFKLYHQFIFYA